MSEVKTWRPRLTLQFLRLLDALRDLVARWGRDRGGTHLESFSAFLAQQGQGGSEDAKARTERPPPGTLRRSMNCV